MPTWDNVSTIALSLPETEVSAWHRTPSVKVAGKGFLRLRTEAEGRLVVFCDLDEKAELGLNSRNLRLDAAEQRAELGEHHRSGAPDTCSVHVEVRHVHHAMRGQDSRALLPADRIAL